MANYKIAIDAGHGGSDYGATFNGRKEKDDNLALALAVGKILEKRCFDVYYTRTEDVYDTPFTKATKANQSGADLFVSIHRNSSEIPNKYNGVQTLLYNTNGIKKDIADSINSNLENVGFKNLGISIRPNLVVLKRTRMPALLVEAGFINSDIDNEIFDNNLGKIATAIADSITETLYDNGIIKSQNLCVNNTSNLPNTPSTPVINNSSDYDETYVPLYRVQVGAFKNRDNAERMLNSLIVEGFPAFIIYEDDYYKVQVGAFRLLTNAIKMEQRLRRYRYNTYIVYS